MSHIHEPKVLTQTVLQRTHDLGLGIHFLPTATVIPLLLCHIKLDMSKSAFVVNKVYPEYTELLSGEVKHTHHSEWAERKNFFVVWIVTLWFYVKILEL